MLTSLIAGVHQAVQGLLLRRQVLSRVSRLLSRGGFARRQLMQALDRIERRSDALESIAEGSRKAA